MKRKDSKSSGQERASAKDEKKAKALRGKIAQLRRGIISPRDERGVPYPGDWPNPLGEKNRGCF